MSCGGGSLGGLGLFSLYLGGRDSMLLTVLLAISGSNEASCRCSDLVGGFVGQHLVELGGQVVFFEHGTEYVDFLLAPGHVVLVVGIEVLPVLDRNLLLQVLENGVALL